MPDLTRPRPRALTVGLPQHDHDPEARARSLEQRRAAYAYADPATHRLAPISVSARFPLHENFAPSWVVPYLPLLLRAKVTELSARAVALARPEMGLAAHRWLANRWFPRKPYEAVYATDAAFARERLDGPNPVVIERVVDAARISDFTGAPGLVSRCPFPFEDALAEGRLYLADYGLLREALPAGRARDSRWRDRYLPAPRLLLCHAPGVLAGSDLVPLAIRIDGGDADSPVFVAGPGTPWQVAKLFVRIADVNLHIMSTHLARTHYRIEPFAVTTPRRLSDRHPVHVLLEPHLRFTLAVNRTGDSLLANERQVFAGIYAGTLETTRKIIVRSGERWTFADLGLEADLEARGMADAPLDYPYRDDARLHHRAIARFVEAYLALFYPDDAAVAADPELRGWLEELEAPDGGNLRGLDIFQAGRHRAGLARLLTEVLFTAGPGHAAVHFPQPDYHGVIAAYPAAAWAPPPRSEAEATPAYLETVLPPFSRAAMQFRNSQLADFRYDRFGDYSGYPLGHVAAARAAVQQLRLDLEAIEAEITARNVSRAAPYPYLLPSRVPNSINL